MAASVLVVWGVLAAIQLVSARAELEDGERQIQALRDKSTEELLSRDAVDQLRDAEGDFASARRRVRGFAVTPLRALPVVGRQLRSVDALAASAAAVARAGADAADEVLAAIEDGLPAGAERVRFLEQVATVGRRAQRVLRTVDLGPEAALVAPLAEARERLRLEIEELDAMLEDLAGASHGIAGLFDGPSRILLLAANNTEMRAGSGMFLNAGVVELSDGRLRLDDMQPTEDLQLDDEVPVPADMRRLWGWMEPGRDWRNLAASPRFELTGPLAARMWEAGTGEAVDAVLAVDVLALQALLTVTGPVSVPGRDGEGTLELDHDTVVEWAFIGQYAEAEAAAGGREERRDRLGDVAAEVVRALDAGGMDLADLVRELRTAVQGRHLLAWSASQAIQDAFELAGLDGALDDESLLVAVLNRGANKLDQFLQTDVELAVDTDSNPPVATLRVELRNRTPDDAPAYVRGPTEGTYKGILAVSLPGTPTGVRIDDDARLVAAGADGPTYVVGVWVEVAPGERLVREVSFQLPPGGGRLRIEPTARHPAPKWVVNGGEHGREPPPYVAW